jgi:hypothetical protein
MKITPVPKVYPVVNHAKRPYPPQYKSRDNESQPKGKSFAEVVQDQIDPSMPKPPPPKT